MSTRTGLTTTGPLWLPSATAQAKQSKIRALFDKFEFEKVSRA